MPGKDPILRLHPFLTRTQATQESIVGFKIYVRKSERNNFVFDEGKRLIQRIGNSKGQPHHQVSYVYIDQVSIA